MSPLTAQILAQLPFPEKVRIVEKLREASLRIAESGKRQCLRKQTVVDLSHINTD